MLSSIRGAKSAACETRHKGVRAACLLVAVVAVGLAAGITSQIPAVGRQLSVISCRSAVVRWQTSVDGWRSGAVVLAGFGSTRGSALGTDLLTMDFGRQAVDPAAAGQQEPGLSHRAAGPVEEEHAGRGIVDVIARIINFALLVGILAYFLKSPIRTYLSDRGEQIRTDLVNAARMRETAAAQIAEIDGKMKALPAELDALRRQGAEDIAAEEARIREAAAAERERLLEQARREIDLQVKVAERGLVAHAAELAVGVASERIKRNITDEDQKRLVDRYVQQLRVQH